MGNTKSKKYWKSPQQFVNNGKFNAEAKNEFSKSTAEALADELDTKKGTNRRDFLKAMGFTTSVAAIVACQAPVRKIVPYAQKPVDVTPGVPNYYASTFYNGYDYADIVIKTREGRPIHIEGNELSKITKGSTGVRVNSSTLTLYDSSRLPNPLKNGEKTDWETALSDIETNLSSVEGRKVLLTETVISPTSKKLIKEFSEKFDIEHIEYDAVSYSGMLDANAKTLGKRVIPSYDFEKADVILGVEADFLSTWLFPNKFIPEYSKRRNPNKKMNKHFQFETNLTVTGSNADIRVALKPSEYGAVIVGIYNELAKTLGEKTVSFTSPNKSLSEEIKKTAKALLKAGKNGLVVCGINHSETQVLVNKINNLLGSYGNAISLSQTINLKNGDDKKVRDLILDMNAGKVGALITSNVNPAYNLKNAEEYISGVKKVLFSAALANKNNESASIKKYALPLQHQMESWGDFEAITGEYGFAQPVIQPFFNTKQFEEILLLLLGKKVSYREYVSLQWGGSPNGELSP